MAVKEVEKFLSLRIIKFLMRVVGFWTAETEFEKRLLNGLVGYTICTLITALWIEGYEIQNSVGDFYVSDYKISLYHVDCN